MVWPIRWQRDAAWTSFWGLKSESMKITVSADIKFKPIPPALVDNKKQKLSEELDSKFFIAINLSLSRTLPSRRSYENPEFPEHSWI